MVIELQQANVMLQRKELDLNAKLLLASQEVQEQQLRVGPCVLCL